MLSCKPINTPISTGKALSNKMCLEIPEENAQMKTVPYVSAIGSLMYALSCTRPDIYFIIGLVSRYQPDPELAHWKVVKRIITH